jgi:hypothetical protein
MECRDLLCDVCGHDAHVPATHRTRIIDDVSRARLRLDLCDEHWDSLATGATALAAGSPAPRALSAAANGSSNGHPIGDRRDPAVDHKSGRWAEHPCPVPGCTATPSGGPGMRVHLESHRNRGEITDAEYDRLREDVKRGPKLKTPAGIVYPIDCPVPGCDRGVPLQTGGIAAAHLRAHARRGDTIPPTWVEFASLDQWAGHSKPTGPQAGYPRACPVPGCDRGPANPIPSAGGYGAHAAKHKRDEEAAALAGASA